MSSGDPPAFPFQALPIHIQESILSLLPISSLLPLLTVSRSFLSLLRHSPTLPPPPPDLFFLLFSPSPSPPLPSLLSFHPSSRRFLSLPLPPSSPLSSSLPFATSSSLAISPHGNHLVAIRMFAKDLPPIKIPPMIPVGDPYVLAVVPEIANAYTSNFPSDHFKIVAASCSNRGVFTQVYDSRRGHWVPAGEIARPFVVLGDTALINKSLYVHACLPDQILRFDLVSHTWEFVIHTPDNMLCSHMFSYNENLYLIVGFEVFGVISSIRVLRLDWGENLTNRGVLKWSEISTLSETSDVFMDFTSSRCWLYFFKAVDRAGMVCLHNSMNNKLVLFDVRDMSWVSLPPCRSARNDAKWYGHATEMGLEVLRSGVP